MSDKTDKVKLFIAETIANDGNTTKIGDRGDLKLNKFKMYCKKCGADNTLILTNFNYSQGSEYTGIYGQEVILLFKCKDCGNTERIVNDSIDYF